MVEELFNICMEKRKLNNKHMIFVRFIDISKKI